MIFRPDIKPPMWGPLDAVQYAVRENAERMEIDPASIFLYAPFWEGAGLTTVNVGSSGNIALTAPAWQPSGIEFNGTSTLGITSGNGPSGTGAISYGFRFASTKTDGVNRHIFNIGLAATNNMTHAITYEGKIKFGAWGFDNITSAVWCDGKVHHVCIVYDGTKYLLYVDGAFVQQSSDYSSLNIAAATIYIGEYRGGGSFYFNGLLDIPFIVRAKLTPDQIAKFNATPYALLMPVVRPVYSFGATSGTTGTFAAPAVSVQPAISAGNLVGSQSGALTAPSLTIQPAVTAGALSAALSGAFSAPALSVQPVISAGVLTGSGAGVFSAPSLSILPVVAAGSLLGAQAGAFVGPAISLQPSITAGTLAGAQSGNFTGPALTIWPDVSAGVLAGVSTSAGAFVAPWLSVQPVISAGVLWGGEVLFSLDVPPRFKSFTIPPHNKTFLV